MPLTKNLAGVFVACLLLNGLSVLAQTTSAFGDDDAAPLMALVEEASRSDGSYDGSVEATHHAVRVLQLLGKDVDGASKACDYIHAAKAASVGELYHLVAASSALGCVRELTASQVTLLEGAVNDATQVQDMYYAVEILSTLVPSSKLGAFDVSSANALTGKIMALYNDEDGTFRSSEDSEDAAPMNAAYALNALAALKATLADSVQLDEADNEQIVGVGDKIESFLETAEGEDLLSFSDNANSLKATSMIVSGIVRLSKALGTPLQISGEQMAKFAEYLVENKNVGTLENAHYVLEGLNACATNHLHVPLVAVVTQGSVLTAGSKGDAGLIKVRVTDVMGKAVSGASVSLNKAFASEKEDAQLMGNQKLSADANGDAALNFIGAKPAPGYYTIDLRIEPAGDDARYEEVESTQRIVKVVTSAAMHSFEMIASDSANELEGANRRVYTASHPGMVGDEVQVDESQFLHFNFRVRNTQTNKMMDSLHQTFVRFTNDKTGKEVLFHARVQGRKFKRSVSIKEESEAFTTGTYTVSVLVGDMFVKNAITWPVAKVAINVADPVLDDAVDEETIYEPRPVIEHVYRTPDSRPPEMVSFAFTALVLSPLLLLFVRLGQVGANINGMPKGVKGMYALGFVASIAAIMVLYATYWLMLNMFQCLTILGVISVPTYFLGWLTLSALNEERQKRGD